MKKPIAAVLPVLALLFCTACGAAPAQESAAPAALASPAVSQAPAQTAETPAAEETIREEIPKTEENSMEKTLELCIGETPVAVTWEENASVEALRELAADAPLTVQMSMYGGFEQVGSLGRSLPRDDVQTSTQAGDIVLYSGNQIVIFYGANSWAYTRLGRITDQDEAGMRALLGGGDVSITLS